MTKKRAKQKPDEESLLEICRLTEEITERIPASQFVVDDCKAALDVSIVNFVTKRRSPVELCEAARLYAIHSEFLNSQIEKCKQKLLKFPSRVRKILEEKLHLYLKEHRIHNPLEARETYQKLLLLTATVKNGIHDWLLQGCKPLRYDTREEVQEAKEEGKRECLRLFHQVKREQVKN